MGPDGMNRNLMGIYTIWLRDVRRFWRDKPRIIGATIQPALFLFLLGTGLGKGIIGAFGKDLQGDYLSFIYPGIIGMSILFTSIFSAISIIWDREIGFLKEVMVAPISRWAVAVGKAFGGSTVAVFQGCLMLIFAPFVNVHINLIMIATLIPLIFLIAFSITSLGIVAAARMRSMQGFQVIMNFLVLPMFFLSGAMFPITNLPKWMDIFIAINPLTYGVDALRGVILGMNNYPIIMDVGLVAGFGIVMIAVAMVIFGKGE